MSRTTGGWLPPGAATDQGLAPTVFTVPPQGAMAGLPLVVRTPTTPASVIRRVQYAAVPKWLLLRTATAPMPWVLARSTASRHARSVIT